MTQKLPLVIVIAGEPMEVGSIEVDEEGSITGVMAKSLYGLIEQSKMHQFLVFQSSDKKP